MFGVIAASNRRWQYDNFNLFIGGVGGVDINSIADLQNYITKNDSSPIVVEKFEIDGTTVKARLNVSPKVDDSAFLYNSNITFLIWAREDIPLFLDFQCFQASTINFFYSFNTSIQDGRTLRGDLEEVSVSKYSGGIPYSTLRSNSLLRIVHLPYISTISSDNFIGVPNIEKVYVSSQAYNSTDSGTITAINNIISEGGQVIEIMNNDRPERIMDLTVNDISNGDYQLNFTPPSSTNNIQYYEVFVDDGSILSKFKYRERINASGDVISGINSGDKIWLMAVDEYYNHSEVNSYVNQIGLMSGDVVTI